MQRLRTAEGLLKPPGVAETLDWARALEALGAKELDVENAAKTWSWRARSSGDPQSVARPAQ